MGHDEYELIVEKSCNSDSSQLNHTKAESLLLDMKRSQVGWLAHLLTKSGTSTLSSYATRKKDRSDFLRVYVKSD